MPSADGARGPRRAASRCDDNLRLLHNLPQALVATDVEILTVIDNQHLFGVGIGYVDAHLLGVTMLTTADRLWTRDGLVAGSGS